MIIRSQDKKRIANFSVCNLIAIVGTQEKSKNITVDGMVIGTYSTEEKAIKVLDDICTFSNGIHFEKIATDQCGRLDGVVFQMPQDSEV